MALFSLSAFLLLVTMLAFPVVLAVLGVRQYKWWHQTHAHVGGGSAEGSRPHVLH